MKWLILLLVFSSPALAGDKFQVGDCAYIPVEKEQDPKGYIIRKIVDKTEVAYTYQFRNKPTNKPRFQKRDKTFFDNENDKMKCPGWFK